LFSFCRKELRPLRSADHRIYVQGGAKADCCPGASGATETYLVVLKDVYDQIFPI
jgi:hypothetical protein